MVVDDAAGTTVDPVDELVQLGGRTWRFIDTAGIRKRVKEASGHEYYASLRTGGAIERAEVCVLVVDASQPISEQDLRIMTNVAEAGRALVVAFNKWDLVDEERRYYLDREIERDLVRDALGAAREHHRPHRLARRQAGARAGRGPRGLGHPRRHRGAQLVPRPPGRRAPAPGAGRQAAEGAVRHPGRPPSRRRSCCSPPASLEDGYLRYIERRLREQFGFVGTPIHLQQRPRKKRTR